MPNHVTNCVSVRAIGGPRKAGFFKMEQLGQREKELELKMGHKSSDQSEIARNGQKIKLRNRATLQMKATMVSFSGNYSECILW